MYCPQCGSRTEVVETRGPFRDRRCRNADCVLEFTTREQLMNALKKLSKKGRQARFCARTRATQIKIYPLSPVTSAGEAVKSHPAPAPHLAAVAAAMAEAISHPAPAQLAELGQPPVVQQAMLEFGSN